MDAPSEVDVRGQRLVSVASYGSAVVGFAFAAVSFAAGSPQVGAANLVVALAIALVPLLKRLGPLAPAIGFVATATVSLLVLSLIIGTGAGLSLYFVIMAAAAPMIVGSKRPVLALAVLGIAITAVVGLHLGVPSNTGRLPDWLMTVGFIANAVGASVLAFVIVGYGLLQIQRAEDALEEEYERSEALLDNILPRSIAQRLKQPTHMEIADTYDDASILFADIAGFTAMSSHTSPTEVVRFLDRLYTELDALVERHGLEKIKTTGDSYMVVSGVPEPRSDHLQALARFALDMHDVCAAVNSADGGAMPLRVGLADGPVVAGVIGSTKFFYDVWGDAVNLASRMESTGVPGRIQVTASVRDRLAGSFVFEERGVVAVKGKDDQNTWFLVGERPRRGALAA
nr:adenylate/guanylate cyclase domain-containing protein [Gordonia araii]